jgi:DNA-binding SARP family transcriptional activator
LLIDGRPFDFSRLKPRPLQLLRLLAIHGGRLVHREVLIEALWPAAHRDAGARCLHVAISSLRRVLQSAPGRSTNLVERSGDAYRLALPEDLEHDIVSFERWFGTGRVERRAGNAHRAVSAFRRVLEIHRGDLLPEDGPAEWVSGERERYRSQAAEAAHELADILVGLNDPIAAAQNCERGLRLNRYNDSLWRMLIAVHHRAGDAASAARARRRYDEVLHELGVSPASA